MEISAPKTVCMRVKSSAKHVKQPENVKILNIVRDCSIACSFYLRTQSVDSYNSLQPENILHGSLNQVLIQSEGQLSS